MHGLKAVFFVEPMPALVCGVDWLKPLVATILARGQEVQLHLHPNWAGAKAGDGGAAHARFEMVEYSAHEQRRSEEHTSELQSLMRISYAVFCLKKKIHQQHNYTYITHEVKRGIY